MVGGTVEETLNPMLEAEADRLCGLAGTSAARRGKILELAVKIGRCRPVPRSI